MVLRGRKAESIYRQLRFMVLYMMTGLAVIYLVEFIRTRYFPAATGSLIFEALAGLVFLTLSAPLISSVLTQFKRHRQLAKQERSFLVENIPFGIIQSNENGEIISANTAACELLGYPETELMARDIKSFLGEENIPVESQGVTQAQSSTTKKDIDLSTESGAVIPIELVCTQYASDDGQCYMSFLLRDRRAELESRAVERRASLVFNSVSNPIMIASDSWEVAWCNESALAVLGSSHDDVVGKRVMSLQKLRVSAKEREFIKNTVLKKGVWRGVVAVGEDVESASPFRCTLTLIGGEDNIIIANFESIAELMEAKSELTNSQSVDALTGLLSYKELEYRINRDISDGALRDGRMFPVIVFNIDSFRQFNIAYDREGGDRILQAFAAVLKERFPSESCLARLHADSFAAYIPQQYSLSEVNGLVDKVKRRLSSPLSVDFGPVFLTVSVGVDSVSQSNAPARRVISNAEYAVSSAKEIGRNLTRFYSSDISESANHFVKVSSELTLALKSRQLVAAYQAIVKASDYSLHSVEALVRWNHPVDGVRQPDSFIPIAEKAGLMPALSRAVLDSVSSDFAALSTKLSYGSVSINFSPTVFVDSDFVDSFIAQVHRAYIPPQRLIIEITESTLMRDTISSIAAIAKLREAGVGVVIDDFGTGYSSLSYLGKFNLDGVKVDKLMLQGVPQDAKKAEVLKNIIATAKALNLYVVMEGVETAEQASFLRREGADYLQGHYFSRPVLLQDVDFDKAWELYRRPLQASVEEGGAGYTP